MHNTMTKAEERAMTAAMTTAKNGATDPCTKGRAECEIGGQRVIVLCQMMGGNVRPGTKKFFFRIGDRVLSLPKFKQFLKTL